MAATSEGDETSPPEPDDESVGLQAHSTSPDRTVFTEPGNSDGWLATDHTVDVER